MRHFSTSSPSGKLRCTRVSLAARANPDALAAKAESELLLALAPHLDDFLGRLFGIEAEVQALASAPSRAGAALHGQAPVRAAQGDAQVQGRQRRQPSTGPRSRRSSRRRSASRSASSRSRGTSPTGRRTKRRNAARLELALRYAAWAAHHAGGQEAASRRRAVQGAGQARSAASRAGDHR